MKTQEISVDYYSALIEILNGTAEILEHNRALIQSIEDPRYKKSLTSMNDCAYTCRRAVIIIDKNVQDNILRFLPVCEDLFRESAEEWKKMDVGIFRKSARVAEHCASAVNRMIKKLAKQ